MPEKILKKYFGYDHFRPLQREIIEAVEQGKDTLVIMPTGSGKSLCYQIPAIHLPGTAIVISPLISLMKDQVDALRLAGVKAAYLNSTLNQEEQQNIQKKFCGGKLDLLYISPEKISTPGTLQFLRKTRINLFAIDEAHCISSWGHDFRPDYKALKAIKQHFPNTPVLALTATADKLTRLDIINLLQLKKPARFIASFDRPNISLEVRPGQKRLQQILSFIRNQPPDESGIIYCLSKKSTENLAQKLRDNGLPAAHYHAGMSSTERSRIQEAFLKDETPIICATVAFGMGIDKSNVRWVIHYNMPKNIESYYQEIGRSGRDGLPAKALLFYSYADVMTWQQIIIQNENTEYAKVQQAKLERIKQYAEAVSCRRRILLTYFHEDRRQNCNHCDICNNPPQQINGTIIAQKALSAIYRLKENVGLNMLINILRGSQSKEIFRQGYHNIKTYGQGREYSFAQWRSYLLQLLNLGYLEMAPDNNMNLKLTAASHRVLFENEQVELVEIKTINKRLQKKKTKTANKNQDLRNALFKKLRQLRLQLAEEKKLPPHIIFSDVSLKEMASKIPLTKEQMTDITGLSEKKLDDYGPRFLKLIRQFTTQHEELKLKGASSIRTAELFRQGLTLEQIAEKRQLHPSTILNHLAQRLEAGEDLDVSALITIEEIQQITKVRNLLQSQDNDKLKPIFEQLEEKIPYSKIRLALALEKRGQPV